MQSNTLDIGIIGSGFASLSAACHLAKKGHKVTVIEKNPSIGGRARRMTADGFTFDMGPSWYWMPDVFDSWFEQLGRNRSDYYQIKRLGPSYRIFFQDGGYIDIPTSTEELIQLFEQEEPGAGNALKKFLSEAEEHYRIAVQDIVYRPGFSPLELVTPDTVTRVGLFLKSISSDVRKRFKSERLRSILEFPVLFLGAKPDKTPAFYNFMNYADLVLGTWYPEGGMFTIVESMQKVAMEFGVEFITDSPVEQIRVEQGRATGILSKGEYYPFDLIVSGADYAHTETLLEPSLRVYSDDYWEKRTFAPSSLLFYVGLNKKLENVHHHMLFFDSSFEEHARAIYDDPQWPENPLFYANFPSLTDPTCAPEGHEAAFFLIPLAPGLEDGDELREQHWNIILERLKKHTSQDIADSVVYKRSYGVNDCIKDYNSYKGNAYGLANTLRQTAFLRPGLRSKNVKGLYFTGQLTVPGPGVPPSLISGKVVADVIEKDLTKRHRYAAAL
jgi:phytoene desaturase